MASFVFNLTWAEVDTFDLRGGRNVYYWDWTGLSLVLSTDQNSLLFCENVIGNGEKFNFGGSSDLCPRYYQDR